MSSLLKGFLPLCTLLASFSLTVGCETAPPVQEMSDARQAIAVAREAGAEAHAAEQLLEAERYLHSAEQKLDSEDYADARRDALAAKSKAVAARKQSETSQSGGGS